MIRKGLENIYTKFQRCLNYFTLRHYLPLIITNGKSQRGRGLWRFNATLLNHDIFNEHVKSVLAEDEGCHDLSLSFDTKKARIRGFAIQRCSYLKKRKFEALNDLYQKYEKFKVEPGDEQELERYERLKGEINEIEESLEKGDYFKRCRLEEDETLHNIELARMEISNGIHAIECLEHDGIEVTDQEEILEICKNYLRSYIEKGMLSRFQ